MQKTKDNIIKFPNLKQEWQEVDGDVSTLIKSTLFKNASLVDVEKQNFHVVDILVEGEKIKKIEPTGKINVTNQTEVVDLLRGYVIPSFLNAFETLNVFNVDTEILNKRGKEYFSFFMGMKDILGGVVNYFNEEDDIMLENISQLDEKQLSEISNESAKKNKRIWLKIGQDLCELGAVDKKFGKGVVQVLEDFGILDRQWVLIGGNCLEKDDLRLLRQYGDKIVICPSEDGQLGRRPTNLKTLIDLDFCIRIGSGQAFEIDFFAFMRQVLMTQWGIFEDKSWLSEKDVFLMATNNFPTLQEGMQADFAVITNAPELYSNVLQMLVWGKSKKDVFMTVANGRVLQELGNIVSGNEELDYQQLIEKILYLRRKNNDNK